MACDVCTVYELRPTRDGKIGKAYRKGKQYVFITEKAINLRRGYALGETPALIYICLIMEQVTL